MRGDSPPPPPDPILQISKQKATFIADIGANVTDTIFKVRHVSKKFSKLLFVLCRPRLQRTSWMSTTVPVETCVQILKRRGNWVNVSTQVSECVTEWENMEV